MVTRSKPIVCLSALAAVFAICSVSGAQESPANRPHVEGPAQKPAAEAEKAAKPELPFQIQLLETKIRFEANGDSRKEVHTVVKIINILGAHQFGRISFDYNRVFQQIEISQVRVTHANGGTSEVLPSAVTDTPNPSVEQFPAYHDVRVKAVRILGLQEGDIVEYRVVTTTTHHPLAPNFWLEHMFDRSGQVLEEHYDLELPAANASEVHISTEAPVNSKETSGSGDDSRTVFHWRRTYNSTKDADTAAISGTPDVIVSTLNWEALANRLAELMRPGSKPLSEVQTHEEQMKELRRQPEVTAEVREKATALTEHAKTDTERLKAIYDFVSTKIATVDLPLDATGFHAREAEQSLNSGYATAEDKYVLFAALAAAVQLHVDPALTGYCDKAAVTLPGVFKHLVEVAATKEQEYWLDPALEVAPFGMISPAPAKCALLLRRGGVALNSSGQEWVNVPTQPPFAAFQKVNVDAKINDEGQLSAKVKYVLRGQNELLLRVAFHQTAKEKWKDVASLLAVADGFRGQITAAEASEPTATDDPFTVEYELTQLKFVDWSKKPVRIPALLPQIGMPDPVPTATERGAAIDLGTPLEVQTSMTLHLPAGTGVETPPATSVSRDYAAYSSKYSGSQNTVVASRHIAFIKRTIPADRAADYAAFAHAVQNDQAQKFTLAVGGP